MAKITIINDKHEYVTRSADTDDRWDRDDTDCTHDIKSFRITDEHFYDLMTSFEPEYDNTYFLLYVIYNTGDSFGNSKGQIEYIGLFDDASIAEENKKRIEENNDDGVYSIKLLLDNGNEYDTSCPWIGYFESLSEVTIMSIRRDY